MVDENYKSSGVDLNFSENLTEKILSIVGKNNQLEDQVNRFYKCNRWDDDFKNEFGDLGDIAISYETCIKQSIELGVRLENHVIHLLVHACLHLLGFNHQEYNDFQTMKELEIKCLKACGIENPYAL